MAGRQYNDRKKLRNGADLEKEAKNNRHRRTEAFQDHVYRLMTWGMYGAGGCMAIGVVFLSYWWLSHGQANLLIESTKSLILIGGGYLVAYLQKNGIRNTD